MVASDHKQSFVVYVGKEARRGCYNAGSQAVLSVLDMANKSALPATRVVDASRIPPRQRPLWMNGTPTLVDEETGDVWEGQDAYDFLLGKALSTKDTTTQPVRDVRHSTRPRDVALPTSKEPPGERRDLPGHGVSEADAQAPSGVDAEALWSIAEQEDEEDDGAGAVVGSGKLTSGDFDKLVKK